MINFLRFMSSKRKQAVKPVVWQTANPLQPTGGVSPILTDVLGEKAVESPPAARKASPSPLSQRLSVGARLADSKKKAIEAASKVIELADPETAKALSVLIENLEHRVCCVAFAGQVKAGKSSLINVLVEQPDLLPSDINPWTTVVTKLHFGTPGKPQSGASFTFFNREEWRLLSIGGKTRELTERLFPSFDWHALEEQVQAMQENAARKLGPRFEDLLGTEHSYPEVTPGLLNRYVGAGHPDAEPSVEGAEGEFSDITKIAKVFLDLGAFSFPTVILDTPGVNDPFLVRDEITRQNLEEADICVVVLTARQPLSTADLSLLRMLRGLKKERLVIFINKIDEIGGNDEVVREVSRRVAAIVKQEFPSAHIPIVFGSAIWARKALSSGAFGRPAQTPNAQPAGAEQAGFDWPSHDEIADAVTAETFFLRSGLSSLAVAVSEMMQAGPIADTIRAIAALVQSVGHNMAIWLETEIGISSKLPGGMEAVKSALSELTKLREALAVEIDGFSERLMAVCGEKGRGLEQDLIEALETSIPELVATLSGDAIAASAGQIDAKLRVQIEKGFLASVEDTRTQIASEQQELAARLTQIFEASSLKRKPAANPGQPLSVSPSLAALSEPAALGMTGSVSEFARQQESSGDRESRLSSIIRADFEPMIRKLTGEAVKEFQKQSLSLTGQIRALNLSPLDAAIGRIQTAIQRVQPPADEDLSNSQNLEADIQTLQEKLNRLTNVLATQQPPVPV